MTEWFLKTIGAGDDFLGHVGQATLAAQRPWVFWLGLALIAPIAVFIHRRQRRSLATAPKRLRATLTTIRVLILLALFIALSGPYLRLDLAIEKRPIAAVLVDRSASMDLPAGPFATDPDAARFARSAGIPLVNDKLDADGRKMLDELTRGAVARKALAPGSSGLLAALAKTHDLRLYAFDRDLAPLAFDPARMDIPPSETGSSGSSRLNDAILKVLDDAAGRSVGGIIVLSDGRDTSGRAPTDSARAAAALAVPIFPVTVGSGVRGKDVAILEATAPSLVAVGDTVDVSVTIESPGFDGRPAKVEMTGDGPATSKDVVLRGDEPQVVTLPFVATKPGSFALTIAVPPPADEPESLRANNSEVVYIKVTEEKLRVLLVDGLPRWDFRFLKNALRRDHGIGGAKGAKEPDVRVMAEWRGRAGEPALPATVEAVSEYHAIILGDVSAQDLGLPFLEALARGVREKGVGLIVEAGPSATPHGWPQPIVDLLPVKLRARSSGVEAPAYNPFRLEVTPDGSIHDAMRLFDDPARNANAWAQMPPYSWCASADRAAPGATVLAWNPSVQGRFGKLPLIAEHYAGKGKVLFLGTDSTWLWRRNVGDRFFARFWGQAIRSVARRDDDAKTSRIEVRPARSQPGEAVRVELHAVTPDGTPRPDPKLPLRLIGPKGPEAQEVIADPSRKGRFSGGAAPATPGEYRVSFDPGGGLPPAEARFRVLAATEEMRNPSADPSALSLLASTTGGRVVFADELGGLAKEIKGETKRQEVHREASVWDNGLMLGLLVVLYTLDVGLRRLAGLS